MIDRRDVYDALAGLLTYPGADYDERLAACRALLGGGCPTPSPVERGEAVKQPLTEQGAAERFAAFAGCMERLGATQREELFTQTFDLNPVCSLEVGWHLFGENYNRGEFLVTMRQAMRQHGVEETTELPDHLSHVLATVCRMDPAEADRFSATYVLPAIEKMLEGLRDKENPFEDLLRTCFALLASRVPSVRNHATGMGSQELGTISRETGIAGYEASGWDPRSGLGARRRPLPMASRTPDPDF